MNPKYLKKDDVHFALAHAAEEAGEMIAAIGKTLRWGLDSYNPELPESERESNEEWLRREVKDTQGALRRLLHELDKPADEKTVTDTKPDADELAGELEALHEAAKGCEFDLRPTDGPIARLALFMHNNGDRIITALTATDGHKQGLEEALQFMFDEFAGNLSDTDYHRIEIALVKADDPFLTEQKP